MISLAERLAPEHCALLVVDMQNDYFDENGACGQAKLSLRHHQAIVPAVRRATAAAHQSGVLVVYTRNWRTKWTISTAARDRISKRELGFTGAAGTWGAGWYGVEPTANDVIVQKTGYDAFWGTPLNQILRLQGIKSVVFAGVQTHICVESTARSAFARDYHVIVLGDATAAINEEFHDASLKVLSTHFGDMVCVDAIEKAWCDIHDGMGGKL
jgi:nicotinamidase-related amidase